MRIYHHQRALHPPWWLEEDTFSRCRVFDNPFLSTLPGTGNAQALVTFGPCAGNTIHS
jgi:hypothetical protein